MYTLYNTNGGYWSIWDVALNREVIRVYESEQMAKQIHEVLNESLL